MATDEDKKGVKVKSVVFRGVALGHGVPESCAISSSAPIKIGWLERVSSRQPQMVYSDEDS